jgi:hypothetical protein
VLATHTEHDLADQILNQYLTTNRRGWAPQSRLLRDAVAVLVDLRRKESPSPHLGVAAAVRVSNDPRRLSPRPSPSSAGTSAR